MAYAKRLDKEDKIKLDDYSPSDTQGVSESDGRAAAAKSGVKLAELQELLYAAGTHSVLIVLQGIDTSGKDGTIGHVFTAINPEGVNVASFKQPTPLEAAHDFLWRVHRKTPPKGMMTIFNRSHYEDVLVVRVHELVPDRVWKRRYEQIIAFESLLTADSTIVLKFFLNISKSEQERRLLAREQDPTKGWKLSAGDWHERKLWDKYIEAYEDAIGKTARPDAPWYIVPANHKWFRNMVIAQALVDALEPHRSDWNKTLESISTERRKELAAMRASASFSAHGGSASKTDNA